jgi:membrane-bound lytic murein transglycosylase B
MLSYITSLSLALALVFALTACTSLSKHDSVLGDSGEKLEQQEEKAKQQEQYNTWFQSLTPKQRAEEIQRQHERALSP